MQNKIIIKRPFKRLMKTEFQYIMTGHFYLTCIPGPIEYQSALVETTRKVKLESIGLESQSFEMFVVVVVHGCALY